MRKLRNSEGSFTMPPSIYALEGVLHTRAEKRNGQHDMTAQKETTQDNAIQYKTVEDKTRQDKTRQDKTRQDKTRQDKTRQYKTIQAVK